ncbi:YciI family protein [Caulobacter sp. 17J80-11]|uniref:YciI family protein n=1 Tax=Caulobacter sp. 17J80-11 TaxID=2763502 RepID=UPI001653DD27|nr:YciI family protein [Caulobacter sp. 17J80-11]MBC6982178.1 YciI family protein [Caulobacter sp. 17J80-11]
MRFIVFVKANADTEAGVMPTEQEMAEMMSFNEKLVAAGLMRDGEGMHPTSAGARVRFDGATRTAEKGPFPLNNTVAGFWMLEAGSLDEVIEWMKQCPNPTGQKGELEIRQLFDPADFGEALTPELIAREQKMREQVGG